MKEKSYLEVRTVLLYTVALICCRPNILFRQVILPQKSQRNMKSFEQALAKMSSIPHLLNGANDTFLLYRLTVDKDY